MIFHFLRIYYNSSIGLFENLGVDIRNEKEVIKNYIKVQESFNKKILFNF